MLTRWWGTKHYTPRLMLCSQTGIALVTILALRDVISVLAATYTLTIRAHTALRGAVARERAGSLRCRSWTQRCDGRSP
jgi:hypothetical protein